MTQHDPPLLSRRAFATGLSALVVAAVAPDARAFAPVRVAVPNTAVGAIAAAVGGKQVDVVVDASLAADSIQVGDQKNQAVADKLLHKSQGAARDRFLDDARNAPKLGAAIKRALGAADPAHRSDYEANHRAWSRPFARKILAWQRRLASSKVSGKTIRDAHGRVYLLEWAGAIIKDSAKSAGPAALAKLPAAPSGPTLGEYEAYVTRLVAALT